ncbi:YrhA family protein [Citrobacter koseri]|uniref:YrhA family protein n=1 Tax=Citrobacter koseri TaxID=545 RepID=UPI00388F1D4A|nr:hypothetical protein [Citrobacter koseri]
MDIKIMIDELIMMMSVNGYPIQVPISTSFIKSIMDIDTDKNIKPLLKDLGFEVKKLLLNQPDFITFLELMDGFEFNGLTLFSFAVPEPTVNNVFLMNDFYRNNNDYIDPELEHRLVIGEDSISLFTYDTKTNLFEIRDNVSSESVYGSFNNFSDFLSELLDTVRV